MRTGAARVIYQNLSMRSWSLSYHLVPHLRGERGNKKHQNIRAGLAIVRELRVRRTDGRGCDQSRRGAEVVNPPSDTVD